MKMNLPNKLTMFRIFLTLIIIVILLFPFHTLGFDFPKYMVDTIYVDSKYVIAGILFIIASLTDFLDGYIARKYNLVTDFGKMVDSIADKILVNSVLIILTGKGLVHPLITVTIIVRDSVTNAIKMVAGSKGNVVAARKLGKIKATLLMVGIILLLFANLPFSLINLKVADFLLIMATILAVISAIEYYQINKHLIFEKNQK
jgi:CDP-diacylglycerol--glycerol-3-phosphate 3-phosphatidyltransferase